MKILIVGATGMLGNTLFRYLSSDKSLEVYGTARSLCVEPYFPSHLSSRVITNINIENHQSLIEAYIKVKPDAVINCIGLIKQLPQATHPLKAIFINAQFPHQLSALCKLNGSRLLHISTDCVFSGKKGNYLETDFPDAEDLYGRTKLLGEVNEPHAVTIRTSLIGHELRSNNSLLGWFLSQEKEVRGFSKAIFSGLPTIELAKVIKEILNRPQLTGLYNVAASSINKYDLLELIANIYKKSIHIIQDTSVIIDRSLNPHRFNTATGYVAPAWPDLIHSMHHFACDQKAT